MMIKRFATYLALAFAMCLSSFSAQASERLTYVMSSVVQIGGSFSTEKVKHEATLYQWRQASDSGNSTVSSNLIALSNHFGLASASPFGVPDWDKSANA